MESFQVKGITIKARVWHVWSCREATIAGLEKAAEQKERR
jgi:hypothetical protein